MTDPVYIHQAIISATAPIRSACGESGPSVARAADVTCLKCKGLAAERSARAAESDEFAAADEADEIERSCAEENQADVAAQAEADLHDAHAIPAGDDSAEAKRDAKRAKLLDLADPDCERCGGSGLDPETTTTTKRADGQTVYHLTEPCDYCIGDDEAEAPGTGA